MKAFEQPLSELEEKEMIKRSQSGDMDARNILVEKNMRLVAHMIKKYMVTRQGHRRPYISGYYRHYKGSEYI